jgi:hypothetical protein
VGNDDNLLDSKKKDLKTSQKNIKQPVLQNRPNGGNESLRTTAAEGH